jgi:hypothetical protein
MIGTSARRHLRVRVCSALALTGIIAAAAPVVAEATCKTYKHRAKVESDPIGTDLAYLNISMRVCYNGKRITKAGVLDITPAQTANALGTMKFDGPTPDPLREYRTWRGRSKGSFYVKAGGNWTQQAVGFEGKTSYVWASMRIFGNGSVQKDRQNG